MRGRVWNGTDGRMMHSSVGQYWWWHELELPMRDRGHEAIRRWALLKRDPRHSFLSLKHSPLCDDGAAMFHPNGPQKDMHVVPIMGPAFTP